LKKGVTHGGVLERAMVNRIAGELGPMSVHAPAFPAAGAALAPLRAKAEAAGSDDSHPCGRARPRVSVENFPRNN
jgi:hypothetical protein